MKPVNGVSNSDYFMGKQASEFYYASFDGTKVSLSAMKGKYILLDFWESWCGVCIYSIPEINNLYETYKSKGLNVIGVTTQNQDEIKKIIKANGVSYPTLRANTQILDSYKVSARPTYVLIDKEGKIIGYTQGNLDSLRKTIEVALN